MSYKWKKEELKTIDYHIKKHIIDNKEEMKLWEQEYKDYRDKTSRSSFDDLVKNYSPPDDALYSFYRTKPFEIIKLNSEESIKYIYKSKSHYSCNYKRKKDALTTCINLKFNKKGNDAEILTCFFKKNIVNDSLIIYIAKYLLKHTPKDKIYTIKGVMGVHNGNFNKALNYCNYNSTNSSKKIDITKSFIYKYLSLQFEHMYYSKEFHQDDYIYYYPLLMKVANERERKNLIQIELKENEIINIINSRRNEILNYLYSGEIIEGLEEELALVELSMKCMDDNFIVTSELAKEMINEGLLI